MSAPDPGADTDLMAPGRMWEEAGEHSKAIDAYLKVIFQGLSVVLTSSNSRPASGVMVRVSVSWGWGQD